MPQDLKTVLFKTEYPSGVLYVILGILSAGVLLLVFGDGQIATRVLPPRGPAPKAPVQVQGGPEPEGSSIEYVSNELLIKVKVPAYRSQLKIALKIHDTGISSFNALNKKHKVAKFQKLAKPHAKSKIKDHPVYRWYKITLPGKREVIQEPIGIGDKWLDLQDPPDVEKLLLGPAPARKLKQALADYQNDPSVETVQLNYIVHTTALPNDTYVDPDQNGTWSQGAWSQPYEDLWGLKKIQADQAWEDPQANQGEGVIVAVVDTGLDYNHEDIQGNVWTNPGEIPNNGIDDDGNCFIDDYYGFDFSNSIDGNGDGCYDSPQDTIDSDPMDEIGHGTHVAGTIAAVENNTKGVVGVAPKAKIMTGKGFGGPRSGFTDVLAEALRYVTDNGAQVINNSWGCGVCPSIPLLEDAVQYAHDRDVVIVFAAGNSSQNDVAFRSPQNQPETISVSAFNQNDQKADFSSYGFLVDVAAPGGDSGSMLDTPSGSHSYVNILSLRATGTDMYLGAPNYTPGEFVVGDTYYRARGTSMAAPHVSGLAVLIRANHPEFTPEDVRQVLRVSADDVDASGFDIYSGYGRINALRALNTDSVLRVAITSPGPASSFTRPRNIEITGTASGPGFVGYELSVGGGTDPSKWTLIYSSTSPVVNGLLGIWNAASVPSELYTLKLTATDSANRTFDALSYVYIEQAILEGWPIEFPASDGLSGVWISDATVGDVDGDGQEDIVGATAVVTLGTSTGNHLFAVRKDGSFLFEPVEIVSVNGFSVILPSALQITDLDGDGVKEIVGVNFVSVNGAWSNEIFALSPRGEMLSGWPKTVSFPGRLLIGDINGDGEEEIVFSEEVVSADGSWTRMPRALARDGSFLEIVPESTGFVPRALVDADRDGSEDIIGTSGGRFVLFKYGSGIVQSYPVRNIRYVPSSLALSRSNPDEEQILAILNGGRVGVPSGQAIHVLNVTTGEELSGWPQPIPNKIEQFTMFDIQGGLVSFADVTGDGQDEVILHLYIRPNSAINDIFVVYSLNGEILAQELPEAFPRFATPIFGDVDQDGRAEQLLNSPLLGLVLLDDTWEPLFDKQRFGSYSPDGGPRFLTDLDQDRTPEIFTTGLNDALLGNKAAVGLFEYSQGNSDLGALSWKLFNHDSRNTRALSFIPANRPPILHILDPDVDDDGLVTISDIRLVQTAFGVKPDQAAYDLALDLNADGVINITDIGHVAGAFGIHWPPFLPAGKTLNFYIRGLDAEGDPLTYSVPSLPPGACFNGLNSDGTLGTCKPRQFFWTPKTPGTYSVTFAVNSGARKDLETLSFTVFDPNLDQDSDGFTNGIEFHVFTDPLDACADDAQDAAWPPDLNNDGVVNITDIGLVNTHYGASSQNPDWGDHVRYDLDGDNAITFADIYVVVGYFGSVCTNRL